MDLGRKMGTEPLSTRAQRNIDGISAGQGTRDPPGKRIIRIGHKRCCWPRWAASDKPERAMTATSPGLQLSKPQTQGYLSHWGSVS